MSETEKYYQKRRPFTGLKHIRHLHDTAPAHISAIVTVLPHPLYYQDLAPFGLFLFPKLKSFLAGWKDKSRQALGSAIHQYLITIPKLTYRDTFKKRVHRLKLCISSYEEYFEGMT